jgi:rhodanese-related sulfurtransferase
VSTFETIDVAHYIATFAHEGAILVDVRNDAEVARGKIPGALHIPLHTLPLRLSEIDKNKVVVFCCQMGGRSAQACQFAVAQGYAKVYNLQGGMNAWLAAGQETIVTN